MGVIKEIIEGCAKIRTTGQVFYNPVQEFNRDLSISVLRVFAKYFIAEKNEFKKIKEVVTYDKLQPVTDLEKGKRCESGISILEALSATGLRSIRYGREIPGVKEILANDLSVKAVENIKENVAFNEIGDIVRPNQGDATMLMYEHRQSNKFDVIDLDPYGCPSTFLDSAVQAVADGGLLLVTATDMAVLAGNAPETCYSKYGSVSLKIKCCHEMAVRILLQCIESHANRYSRYIEPLLSISADFYIRVFVRVYSGANKCKYTTSKLSMVYHCVGCDSFALQPLGVVKSSNKNVRFGLPTGPPVGQKCEHCRSSQHMGGPIWSAPIHRPDFVDKLLVEPQEDLGTHRRIQGTLQMISEELQNAPLYYTLEKLSSTLHVETPPMLSIRSALLHSGYSVSYSHMHKTAIKTDAPGKIVWDIMRTWVDSHPINEKRLQVDSPASRLLSIKSDVKHCFDFHANANPDSRKNGLLRFQENPEPFWGPGTRATAMVGDEKISKSKRNQGKRKRGNSDSETVNLE